MTYSEIVGFENHPKSLDEVLFSGSYPRIFNEALEPPDWFAAYLATYVERDLRELSNISDLATFQQFIALCAGRTAQLLNLNSLADDTGRHLSSIKAWLNILEASYITFRLRPYFANLRKRLVKTPKLHFYDTGLACWLLGIRSPEQLAAHPLRGYIFETWCVAEIAKHNANRRVETGQMFFYGESNRAEADLLLELSPDITLVEAKSAATPSGTLLAGARRVLKHLEELPGKRKAYVIYGGTETQTRTEGEIVPWNRLHEVEFFAPVG